MTTYEYIIQKRECKDQAAAKTEVQTQNESQRMQLPAITQNEQKRAYKSKVIVKADKAVKISGPAPRLSLPAGELIVLLLVYTYRFSSDSSHARDLEPQENEKGNSPIIEANSVLRMEGAFKVTFT